MKFSRITFTWGPRHAQPARWRLGLFAVYERTSVRFGLTDALLISVRGLLLWGLVLAIAGWLGAATALSRVLARRPHNSVTWTDCALLPLRWEIVRTKRGQAYIAEGLEDFRKNRWRDGATKLAAGLARTPATRDGRRELASFYLAARARPRALTTLLEGLAHGDFDRAYFDDVVTTALQGDDFDLALEACARAERRWLGDGRTADARWLMERHVIVLVRAGRHADALRQLDEWQLQTPSANEVRVAALIELKRFPEAAAALDAWEQRQGEDVGSLQLRAHAFAAEGRRDELKRVLNRLRSRQGEQPGYYVFAIGRWLQAGDRVAADRGFEDFRLRFGGERRALEELGGELAKRAEVELLGRCIAVAAEHGYTSRVLQMHLFDAAVARGDWSKVKELMAVIEWSQPSPTSSQDRRSDELVKLLAAALTSEAEGVQRQLVEACRSHTLPLPMIKFMHAALLRAGRYATARDLVDFATLAYPGSRALTEARATAAARADEVASRVAQSRAEEVAAFAAASAAARTERGEASAPGVVVAPAREEEFFDALDAARAEADWSLVLSLITSSRHQRPAWLPERTVEVSRLEILARRQRGDALELVAAVRSFLNGARERSEEILTLAREIDSAGDRSLARAVVLEVAKKAPDFPEANELLKTWAPATPDAPADRKSLPGEAAASREIDSAKKG